MKESELVAGMGVGGCGVGAGIGLGVPVAQGTQGAKPLAPLSPLTRGEPGLTDREVLSKKRKQKATGPGCLGGSPDPLQNPVGVASIGLTMTGREASP